MSENQLPHPGFVRNDPATWAAPVLSDSEIETLFTGTQFGNIDNNVSLQRPFLANACLKTLNGYWNGGTIYSIMLKAGLVTDEKTARLTEKGTLFLLQTNCSAK